MSASLALDSSSRYKDTSVYDEGGELEFALWEPVAEFTAVDASFTRHVVALHEVGFLDALAARYYGPGFEKLWWVIAQANALADPENEMFPGMALFIPPRSAVTQFQTRQGNDSGPT